MRNTILGVHVEKQSKSNILEKIKKYIDNPGGFFHIVSINPENLVVAQKDELFKRILTKAQIQLIDGVGVVVAGWALGIDIGERITGVDLMEELIRLAAISRLRVLLIGGKPNLSLELAECYSTSYPEAKFIGLEGIKNIKNPEVSEEKAIFSIVSVTRPHIIFVSFGSPDQELWIDRHSNKFKNSIVMGVGGAFDFLGKKVRRAPKIVRYFGLEWLFRLILQPWRIGRQLRLLTFLRLVLRQKFTK